MNDVFIKDFRGRTKVSFLNRKLDESRRNAHAFRKVQEEHGHVWRFIRSRLNASYYDDSRGCYIWPDDDALIDCFTNVGVGHFKLHGTGLAICCEFFNNIGIDEFKPDSRVIVVLVSIGIAGHKSKGPEEIRYKDAVNKESPADMRKKGITIAETLGAPRKYVDSLLWHFGRQICTKQNPKCELCQLTKRPAMCAGCRLDNDLAACPDKTQANPQDQIVKRHSQIKDAVLIQNIKTIKQQLADKYIDDSAEKCLFLKTPDNDIHDWGPYIAGLRLTQKGIPSFERKHIRSVLKQLVPGYGGKYLRESTVLPADVCYDSRDVKYPCLAADRSGKPYSYRFMGFRAAITKAFGPSRLRDMLRDC